MQRVLAVILLGFLALAAAQGHAENAAPTAKTILSGDEITLSDCRILRLEGIKAPAPEKLAAAAKDALQALAGDKPLTFENTFIDRYGRVQAYTFAGDKGLQVEMLRQGMAFVYPPVGNEPHLDEMLKTEAEAHKAKRGLWANETYADIPADRADDAIGSFAFVTGTIVDAERKKNMVYLNFGADWKNDFTIAIAAHDLRAFKKAGLAPLTLKGKSVRVRGWVKRDFGPMITVTNPAQIEITAP